MFIEWHLDFVMPLGYVTTKNPNHANQLKLNMLVYRGSTTDLSDVLTI